MSQRISELGIAFHASFNACFSLPILRRVAHLLELRMELVNVLFEGPLEVLNRIEVR
jgi:hypothetical protein